MISTYIRWIFNILFAVFSFGFILPLMISAHSTFVVVLGILYLVAVVPGVLYYVNAILFRNKVTEIIR